MLTTWDTILFTQILWCTKNITSIIPKVMHFNKCKGMPQLFSEGDLQTRGVASSQYPPPSLSLSPLSLPPPLSLSPPLSLPPPLSPPPLSPPSPPPLSLSFHPSDPLSPPSVCLNCLKLGGGKNVAENCS